jgi:RNA polymerase sigma-70 factor (ECF subfamily)
LTSPSTAGFDEFVRAHLPRLVLFVLRLGATLHDAEDAVADALAEAYPRWHEIENPRAWLRVAARHAYFHAEQRRREGLARAIKGGHACEDHASDDGLDICGEGAATVLRQLRLLPPRQREAMALTFDGYTPAEIAAMTDSSDNTVRSNLRYARQRLRQVLEPSPAPLLEVTDTQREDLEPPREVTDPSRDVPGRQWEDPRPAWEGGGA